MAPMCETWMCVVQQHWSDVFGLAIFAVAMLALRWL